MREHCFRLHQGDDLLLSLQAYAVQHQIAAATVLSGVGCVLCARVRDASGVTLRTLPAPMEIVSLTGTVSAARTHVHIAFSKEDLSTVGGHLVPGCIIHTTCELVLLELEQFTFGSAHDPSTGYDELVIASVDEPDSMET